MYLTLAQANKLAMRFYREGREPAIQRIQYGSHDYHVSTSESRAYEERADQKQAARRFPGRD